MHDITTQQQCASHRVTTAPLTDGRHYDREMRIWVGNSVQYLVWAHEIRVVIGELCEHGHDERRKYTTIVDAIAIACTHRRQTPGDHRSIRGHPKVSKVLDVDVKPIEKQDEGSRVAEISTLKRADVQRLSAPVDGRRRT